MLGFKKSAGDDKPPNHTVLSRLGTDSLKGRLAGKEQTWLEG